MKALQSTYGEYCKNHDDAIEKVGEYSKQDAPERIREFLAVRFPFLLEIEYILKCLSR